MVDPTTGRSLTPCETCGTHHYCGPDAVALYIHTLRQVEAMARRSDAHPEIQIADMVDKALRRSTGMAVRAAPARDSGTAEDGQ